MTPGSCILTGQSLWYSYDNTGWTVVGTIPYYSEAERTFSDPCNWALSGLKVLKLWFYGEPNNDANETERMYITVRSGDVNGTVEYGYYPDEDMNDIKVAEWQKWNLELKNFIGVDMNNVSKMYIGFGDASSEVPGGWGLVYFDDIRLYVPLEVDCFPDTYSTYGDWVAYGKPVCWCAPPDGSGYQCLGDADGTTSGFPFYYRVYTGDLNRLINCWKEQMGAPFLDACADMDHKDSGFPFYYRCYTGDLSILIANWKKKDADLGIPGPCPMPE
jgi:hypothetical protein